MLERKRLGIGLFYRNAMELSKAVDFLKGTSFDSENEFYEIMLKGNISPYDLRLPLSLPYEVGLTEKHGRVILSTGYSDATGGEQEYIDRRTKNKLCLHYHHNKIMDCPINTPTLGDVLAMVPVGDHTVFGLGHPDGLLIYGRPSFPKEALGHRMLAYGEDICISAVQMTIKNIMSLFCEEREIDFLENKEGMKKFKDLEDAERVRMQRDFAFWAKVIIDEASWEDRKGLERVMEKLFGWYNQ